MHPDPCVAEEVQALPSWSYREYDVKHDSPEYKVWEDWFVAHGLPLAQIPFRGWVARDVARCTISVKVFAWKPGDEDKPEFGDRTVCYPDKDDDGQYSGHKDASYGVYTHQLNAAPLPFPEVGVSL
jgi:hypothetical protein